MTTERNAATSSSTDSKMTKVTTRARCREITPAVSMDAAVCPPTSARAPVPATAPVDPWIPLMLFALLFGFSMDYQVFLISKIREEWAGGAGNSAAVSNGLASTGRVITSAAAIMICVFGAFVLGDLRVLRVIGLGMAVAVLLDATVVRMVLMPAVLQLMGRANWWFPGRLDRAIPSFLSEVQVANAAVTAHPITAKEGI